MRPNVAAIERELAKPDLDPERRRQIEQLLDDYRRTLEQNPIEGFHPHSVPQQQFLEARTPIQAALCGNQFGKTCALIVKCFAQHLPLELLPSHLRAAKLTKPGPVYGWLLIPAFRLMETVYLPELRKWAPKAILWDQSFDKAWQKDKMSLRFADGGMLHVFTYEQDPDKMVGARLDYVAYDEPPPEPIRHECAMRLVARGGFEAFAMTPVNIAGGGIGWIYRDIWKRRESPDITVVNGSIHDNPLLDKEAVARTLSVYGGDDALERRAREFGEFVHLGGMVYPGGFERHLCDPPSRDHLRKWDIVVGIDPGLKNAAFTWHGFDQDNVAVVFDELLLHERTPRDYAEAIRAKNEQWGIKEPVYVIDPSARNRSLTNAQSVQSELQRNGIYGIAGQNDVQAGVQNVRSRLASGYYLVSRNCKQLREEAEEYRMEDRPDGEFKIVKEKDHLLDSSRYACMSRAWVAPLPEEPKQHRFYQHDFEGPYRPDGYQTDSPPLGAMS